MRRFIPILVIFVGAIALAFWLNGKYGTPTSPTIRTENPIPKLKQQLNEQEIESAQAVAKYLPTSKTRIDDLDSPVVDLLRHLRWLLRSAGQVWPPLNKSKNLAFFLR